MAAREEVPAGAFCITTARNALLGALASVCFGRCRRWDCCETVALLLLLLPGCWVLLIVFGAVVEADKLSEVLVDGGHQGMDASCNYTWEQQ